MQRVVALYPFPDDPDGFMDYYVHQHVPLARTLPGLLGLRFGPARPLGSDRPPYFLIGEMDFADEASLFAALGSELGQQVVADVPNYSPKGVTLQYFEVPHEPAPAAMGEGAAQLRS